MTAIEDVLVNNAQYADRFNTGIGHAPPAKNLAVVSCMDARLDTHKLLGLKEGDAHVMRNAGGVVSDDVIRSLVRLLGTREIMLIHHTDCGMLSFRDDDVKDAIEADTGLRPGPRSLQRVGAGRAPVHSPNPSQPLHPTKDQCVASSTIAPPVSSTRSTLAERRGAANVRRMVFLTLVALAFGLALACSSASFGAHPDSHWDPASCRGVAPRAAGVRRQLRRLPWRYGSRATQLAYPQGRRRVASPAAQRRRAYLAPRGRVSIPRRQPRREDTGKPYGAQLQERYACFRRGIEPRRDSGSAHPRQKPMGRQNQAGVLHPGVAGSRQRERPFAFPLGVICALPPSRAQGLDVVHHMPYLVIGHPRA